MNTRRLALTMCALVVGQSAASATAQEVVTVFGLPLGGKLAKPIALCKHAEAAEDRPCWSERPFRSKTGGLGDARLPKTSLPEWAAYSMIKVGFEPDATLTYVSISIGEHCDFQAMRTSVGARFGPPTSQNGPPIRSFTWDMPVIRVVLRKKDGADYCVAEFRTQDNIQRDQERGRKQNEGRPATP